MACDVFVAATSPKNPITTWWPPGDTGQSYSDLKLSFCSPHGHRMSYFCLKLTLNFLEPQRWCKCNNSVRSFLPCLECLENRIAALRWLTARPLCDIQHMGLLQFHGVCSYVISRVAHAPEMPGTFSPPPRVSDLDMHHGTCVTHVPWCIPGSLTSGFLWNLWRGKRYTGIPGRMYNPQFYILAKGP